MENHQINIILDSRLYSKDSIFKCIYWYLDKFIVNVTLESNFYHISFSPKLGTIIDSVELMDLKNKIHQDFNDFNLRDIISNETKDIRNLLIAKAFSPFDSEEDPP